MSIMIQDDWLILLIYYECYNYCNYHYFDDNDDDDEEGEVEGHEEEGQW